MYQTDLKRAELPHKKKCSTCLLACNNLLQVTSHLALKNIKIIYLDDTFKLVEAKSRVCKWYHSFIGKNSRQSTN